MAGKPAACLVVVIVVLAAGSRLSAAETLRDPGTYVVDQAGLMDPTTRARTEAVLAELQQKTGAQVKLLTVRSTDGEDFFTYVHRHADAWKLGTKGEDNGALIALAVQERKVRIHVGYGLEAALPDSWCGTASRDVAKRCFKRGDYAQGLYDLAVAVANRIAAQTNTSLNGVPAARVRPPVEPVATVPCCAGLLPLLVIMMIVMSMNRRRRYGWGWGGGLGEAVFWGSVLNNLTRGGRIRGGGFGGSFGGGFGGSFGGGGRFGGGGGGASW
jgi:uncharacterized protein